MQGRYDVQVACEVLQVSISGYFRWLSQSKSQDCANTRLGDPLMVTHMRAIHLEVKGEYGWPRMQKELQARSGLDNQYHLYPYRRRLAVSGHHAGLV